MVAIVTGNGLGLQSSSALGLGAHGQVGNAAFGQTGEQLYVNAANGNLVIQDRDQLLLGQGVNSSIYRAYNSLGQFAGDNWRPGGSRTVDGLTGTLNSIGSTVTLTDWDGSSTVYEYDASRQLYVSTAWLGASVAQGDFEPGYADATGTGAYATLSFDEATRNWQWNDGNNGLSELYDATRGGRLVSTRDRDGNTVGYAYNAAGQLAQVTTAGGDVTYLDYNAAGQLTDLRSVYRGMGNSLVTSTTIRYAYDTQGRLSRVTVDLSPEDNSIADAHVYTTTYTYDGTSSRIASITQSDGSQVMFTYLQVNGEYRVATIAEKADDGVFRITTLSYDTANRQTTVTDPLGYRKVLTYDDAGRLISIRSTSSLDGQWVNLNFTYTVNGDSDLRILNDGKGKPIYFIYDAAGNLISQSDSSADVTRTYGSNNELLTETVFDKTSNFANGYANQYLTTRYVYDAAGHLRYVVSAAGRVTEFRYNAAGQKVSEIQYTSAAFDVSALSNTDAVSEATLNAWAAGLVNPSEAIRIDSTYDYRGNLATVTRYEKLLADGTGDVTGAIIQTRYVYDAAGRLLQRFAGSPGNEKAETFTYDGLGRLLCAIQFDGVTTLYQYDDAHHTVSVTFSNGLTRTSTYNAAGELVAVVDSVQGKVQSQIRNYYDTNGRLQMTTDANGLNTHYLYNGRGQCVAQIAPDGTLTEYVYDTTFARPLRTLTYATRLTAAQLASLTNADGTPAERLKSGALLTLDSSKLRPPASVDDRTVWAFYLNNFIDHTVDADGTVTQVQYDGSGRPVVKTVFANRVDTSVAPTQVLPDPDPANDRVTRYFYDQDGLLRGELDPEGFLTEYRYNGAGERVETVRYATATDASLRSQGMFAQLVPGSSDADAHLSYFYDSRGLLCAEVDAEGYVTHYSYDAWGNVTQRVRGQQVDLGSTQAPQQIPVTINVTGTLGSSGSVEIWIDGVQAGALTFDFPFGGFATGTLDVPNIVPLAHHTIEFRYPADSGLSIGSATFGASCLSKADELSTPVGGNASQQSLRYVLRADAMLAWTSRPGQMEFTYYTYDAMGRLTGRTTYSQDGMGGNVSTSWTWDDEGRVASETTAGRTTTYRYDLQGRLIAQLGGEGSTALAALGANATLAQIDAVWQSWGVSYTYDAAGLRTSMTDANGNTTYYYYDVAGHLTHVVNPIGEVVEYQYDAFGDVTETLVYATRVAADTLASLVGGLLPDPLRSTLAVLGDDSDVTRTAFTYSAAGRLVQRTDALGLSTRYTYNTFGEQISTVRDIASNVQVRDTIDYDRLGQAIRHTSDAGGLNLITQAIYDAFGRVIESIDANGVLRRQDYDRNGNVVVVTDGTGARMHMTYDAFRNMLTRTDATGSTTTWSYSEFDRAVTVTTAEGIRTTLTYNDAGQIVTLTDGRGNTTGYTYDRDGNLVSTTDATGATTTQNYDHAGHLIDTVDARGVHTTYSYDATGRVLSCTVDPSGLNLTTRYEYDGKGQATRVTDPSGVVTETRYDAAGHTASVTADVGGLNLLTTFAYDGVGNVLTVTEGAGSSNPRVTQNVFDKAGRLTSTVVDPAGLSLTTGYAYDANGDVVSVTDAAGGVTRYVYDEEGRQIWSVGPTGALVRSVYDAAGRVVARTAFAFPLDGSPDNLTDAYITGSQTVQPLLDQTTQYVYDADGRLRYVVNALNYVAENVYDANGNVISTITYASPVNIAGALTVDAVATALSAQSAQAHASDRTTRMVYDVANRVAASIDALGFVTSNRYDAGGNLLERTQYQTPYAEAGIPDASTLELWLASPGVGRPSGDRTTTWIYDAATRPVYVIDAEGYVTEQRYDPAGHLLTTIRYADRYEAARGASQKQAAALLPQIIPASAAVTGYDYDSAGRLTSTTNAAGVVTRYELDALGRAVNTSVADGLPEQSVTHAVFDAAGRMIEQTRAYGTSIAATSRYTYDGMGRVTAETDPRGVELSERDTAWALAERKARGYVDANGEALEAAALSPSQRSNLQAAYRMRYIYNARGDLLVTADALGYITSNTYDAFGNRVTAADQNRNIISQISYDVLNRAVQVVSPTASIVLTEYDAFGDAVKVTQDTKAVTRMEYDRLGHLVRSTDAEGYSELYAYDAFGNRTGYTNKVGGQFSYTYDRRGLMLSETLPVTSGGQAVVNTFEYDARGNRIATIEAQGLKEERVTRYGYDLLDRQITLTGVSVYQAGFPASTTETRVYDAQGNLTSITDANGHTTTLYYDVAGRKTAQVSPTGTLTLWACDAVGNVIATKVYADPIVAQPGSQPPVPADAANVRETRYVYDADNRLIQSRVQNVATGYFDPSAGDDARGEYFITSGSELVTTWEYDGCGQVTATVDPAGNRTTYFYNKAGQKTLEIDAKGFGIAYMVNAQGNVTQETRFALPFPDPVSASASVNTIVSSWPRSPDDRITNYTWDNNGRLLSESRVGVEFAKVDANGKLVQSTGDATSNYSYDGEGHLLRKVDANGSQYDFTYDALGRLTGEMLPQFADYQNRQVRVTTIYDYDGLNNVVRETRKGEPDQVTTYLYDAGGRLHSKVNALGVATNFRYDAVGNVTSVFYLRSDVDGNQRLDSTTITYDAENREISRVTQTSDAATGARVSTGALIEQRYNAYGEVTGRRTGGGGANGEWQEYADYDNAGRVVRTNFDDGVSHLFMYDRNGNATLKVESMESDLRYRVITTGDDLVALLQSVDMMQTYTRYDQRNQVIQIRQPKTSGGIPTISFSPVDIPIDGGVFANTELSISGWIDSSARPVTGPTLPLVNGDAGMLDADGKVSVTGSWSVDKSEDNGYISVSSLDFSLPDFAQLYGAYNVEVRVSYTASGSEWQIRGGQDQAAFAQPFGRPSGTAWSAVVPMNATQVSVPVNWRSGQLWLNGFFVDSSVTFTWTAEIYVTPLSAGSGPVLAGTVSQSAQLINFSNGQALIGNSDVLDASAPLQVASGLLSVARNSLPEGTAGMLYYRRAGSTETFLPLPKSSSSLPNSFTVDTSGLPDDDYEVIFIAVSDGSYGEAGSLLRRDGYRLHISHTDGPKIELADLPAASPSSCPGFTVDASGNYIWAAPQSLNIFGIRSTEGKLADYIVVRLRDPNNPGWQLDYPVWRNPITGGFQIDMASLGAGVYEISLDLFDSAGAQIDALRGTINLPGNGQSPSFALGYLVDLKSTVVFHSQPAGTDHMVVSWEQDGTTQYTTLSGMAGDFLWDTTKAGLQPDSVYSIRFTAYDTAGRPLSMGQGDIRIGVNATSEVTLTGSALPSIFQFSPTDSSGAPLTNVDTITLYYRESTKQDDDYDRPFKTAILTRDAAGRFLFDAGDLPTNVEYEYRYLAMDAAGNVLMERQSYFLTGTRNNPVTNVDIVGVIEELAKDMTIDRLQQHDAFGEVSAERDGRGNWTYSSYNTMGSLTLKREPTVMVTLENGAQIEMAPLTTYYYDLTGNLVGLKDANGHLSTQQWNYGLAQPAVAQSWDAMGYSKNFSYDAVGNLRVSTDELGRRTDYTYDRANQLIEIARPVLANGQRSIDRYEYDGAGNRIAHTDALGGRERIYYDADGRIVKTVSAAGRTVQYDYRWASTISSIGSVASGGWVKTTIDANGRSMVDEVDLFGRVTKHTDLGGHVFQYTYNWAGLLTKQEGTSGQHVEYSYYSHGLVRSIMDYGTQTQSLYEYDGDGNRTAEFFTDFGNSYVFAQSRVEYDALNRVVAIRDNSYQVGYEYDAVGNRRRMMATYTDMVGYHATEQEYWYEYDALNRFTVSMGSLSGTRATDPDDTSVHIVAGAAGGDGVQLGYNAAGERTMAVYAKDGRTEYYTYDANGLLATQTVDGMMIQQRTNDLLGRVTETIERDRSSGQIVTAVTRDWDADSQLMSEHDNIEGTTTTYTRMADGTLGQVATRPDNGSGTTLTSTYSYEWWDSAKQSQILAQGSNPDAPGWRPASSYFNYDVNGNLKATYDDGGGQAGSARAFTYYTDLRGQVQRRDELVGVTVADEGTIRGATGDRKHNYYYLNGNRVGNQGNDGVETVDYVQELAGRLAKGSESQYKVFTPVGSADFDENFMAINGVYPGVSPGTWTVRDGDTLQSIASSLWGDATLWYILADANGLKGDDVLKAGQMLTVPNQVTNVHNTATTFKPYDPGKAIGNTQPTLPDPPPPPSKDGGCGPVAAIIAVVVAAVATVFTAGAASMALAGTLSSLTVSGAMTAGAAALVGGGAAMGFGTAVAASVIGGAVGAAAAQGVMIAAGEQSGFNWKGVAMGAVGAAVGSSVLGVTGVGSAVGSAFGGSTASQFAGAAAQGAIRSVTTQGIGVLTGAQHSFDWKGVAASAIASGVAYGVGAAVRSVGADFGFNMQSDSGRFVTGVSAGVAAGAASTIVRGGSLGRNVGAISMDAIASTIGNLVVDNIANRQNTSTLYGAGGDIDGMVRAVYPSDPGKQFASLANWDLSLKAGLREQAFVGGLQDQFGRLANDAIAQDIAFKQQLGNEFASSANQALAAQRAYGISNARQPVHSEPLTRSLTSAAYAPGNNDPFSAPEIEYAYGLTSKAAPASTPTNREATRYVSKSFTALPFQLASSSNDVRGGFDQYGNSTAGRAQFDLANLGLPNYSVSVGAYLGFGGEVEMTFNGIIPNEVKFGVGTGFGAHGYLKSVGSSAQGFPIDFISTGNSTLDAGDYRIGSSIGANFIAGPASFQLLSTGAGGYSNITQTPVSGAYSYFKSGIALTPSLGVGAEFKVNVIEFNYKWR
ncbi:YD repeat-containing protein [Paraburkholderia sp. HC6.4b]|uniref:LysM peptidoglycan-binding domain-containing protein n=1 Tax=unclassified Paraburkholderia TaxID=2615204 RepID=UPI00161159A2|nr:MULTISPECIES: LysM peptidoglycan-binding domain-containing protein [unclassified Paraburkholderia]MBB5407663.1 YD repeat-containing protein [Paraburkholderia sp. HC6.4b]MBB5452324.1 YD repeat-containing protein [Paraburkholderia sp. Kb1A]